MLRVVRLGEGRVRIRVLHGLWASAGTTGYVDQLAGGAAPDVEVRTFTWSRARFAAYDVLHLHRPEAPVRRRPTLGRLTAALLRHALLLRLGLRATPALCTVHDHSP